MAVQTAVFVLLFLCLCVVPSLQYDKLVPAKSFRSIPGKSNKIFISTTLGGYSHTKWLLEIGEVLMERGYQVSYIGHSDHIHLAKDYDGMGVYTLETDPLKFNYVEYNVMDPLEKWKVLFGKLNKIYKQDFDFDYNLFSKEQPDVVICDSLTTPCIDAAYELRIPLVVTATTMANIDTWTPYINNPIFQEEPTSATMTIRERFKYKYLQSIQLMWNLRPCAKEIDSLRKTPNGLNRYKRWKNAIRLINNYFGLEPARPLGPLTHMVGPIIDSKQKPLNDAERQFLDSHSRVAYAAFGQHFSPSPEEVQMMMTSIVRLMESGHLDGVIWVGLEKQVSNATSLTISTDASSFTFGSLLEKTSPISDHILLLSWANQFSILEHESVKLFVCHAGTGGSHEALFNGVPMFALPFFSDQFPNSRSLTSMGVARYRSRPARFTTDEVHEDMLYLLQSDDVKKSLERHMAATQLGIRRREFAADLVEEMIYTVEDDTVPRHRIPVARELGFVKAYDIDLHGAVLFAVIVFYKSASFIVSTIKVWRHNKRAAEKLAKLQ